MSTSAPWRVKRVIASVLAVSCLSGCATAWKDLPTVYVSPAQYQSHDCQQLAAEAQRLQVRYTELGGRLDQTASNNKVLTRLGLILCWPALFALAGTKDQEAEYGRLHGEWEAVHQAAILKRCAADAAEGTQAAPNPASPPASAAS